MPIITENWLKKLVVKLSSWLWGAPIFFTFLPSLILADVINPTLVEITVYADKTVMVDVRLNAEAILSKSATYKNSKDSPNAKHYDVLRAQPPAKIKAQFLNNLPIFLTQATLSFDNKPTTLEYISFDVADIGYQGRPRISHLKLKATLKKTPKSFSWHYAKIYGDFVYRHRFYHKDNYNWSNWRWLSAGNQAEHVALDIPDTKTNINLIEYFSEYVVIGYLHILPKGLDHILFIVGIALLRLSWRQLLLLVTLFTLAHSLTLALAIYDLVTLPGRIVEPLIALSIAYIGIENLLKRAAIKFESIVIFLFGLLHGLGFASVLSVFDLEKHTLALSLISFNIGVELGQISIILAVLSLLWFAKKHHLNTQKYIILPSAFIITIFGLVWTVMRVLPSVSII